MHCLYGGVALNMAVDVNVNTVVKNKQEHPAQSVSLAYQTFPVA